MWDTAKKQCVECPLGFYWFNCSRMCVYPSFGYKCQQNCSCEKDLCDVVRGCIESCPNGYHWINCSRPCQYPRFGTRCGQICICEKDNCDHMSGCKKGNKYTAVQSVTRVVSSATHDVSKANTVDFCITDGSSSTTHDVSNVSSDVLNNQLFISLLIISIIMCLICVAYVSIRVIEKYLIQLN